MEHYKVPNLEHYIKFDRLGEIDKEIEVMRCERNPDSVELKNTNRQELQQFVVPTDMANPDSLESSILDLSCKTTSLNTGTSPDLVTNFSTVFTSPTRPNQPSLSLSNNFPMMCNKKDEATTTSELKLSEQIEYEQANRSPGQTELDIDRDSQFNSHVNEVLTINNNKIVSHQNKNILFPEHFVKRSSVIGPMLNSNLWQQSAKINPHKHTVHTHISPTTTLPPQEIMHADLIKKVPRPFKAYPKDPLRLNIGSQYYDNKSNIQYKEYRQKMLERIKRTNETNNKMRRTPRSGSPTSTVEEKDAAYWERRRRNNEAAKRSRDARRAKEDELAIRAAFLENENMKLKCVLYQIFIEAEKRNITFNVQTDYDFTDIFMSVSQINSKDR